MRCKGFTLLELLVAMSVASLLAALAIPSFVQLKSNVKRAAYTNNFLANLALARSESIKRGKRVVLCKSSNGSDCTKAGQWDGGWLIFEDRDNDGVHDADESLIRVESALSKSWRFKGNSSVANYISYHPLGRAFFISGAFQAGTLTLCEISETATTGSKIVISSAGRPRSQTSELTSCV